MGSSSRYADAALRADPPSGGLGPYGGYDQYEVYAAPGAEAAAAALPGRAPLNASEIRDPLFREAVSAIDAGDVVGLEALLALDEPFIGRTVVFETPATVNPLRG